MAGVAEGTGSGVGVRIAAVAAGVAEETGVSSALTSGGKRRTNPQKLIKNNKHRFKRGCFIRTLPVTSLRVYLFLRGFKAFWSPGPEESSHSDSGCDAVLDGFTAALRKGRVPERTLDRLKVVEMRPGLLSRPNQAIEGIPILDIKSVLVSAGS